MLCVSFYFSPFSLIPLPLYNTNALARFLLVPCMLGLHASQLEPCERPMTKPTMGSAQTAWLAAGVLIYSGLGKGLGTASHFYQT